MTVPGGKDIIPSVKRLVNEFPCSCIVATKVGHVRSGSDWTQIFIYPGYQYKLVDALITNFHLPQSTLLMLISALAGREHCLKAYEEAVREKYRFFSFGDAMFIR